MSYIGNPRKGFNVVAYNDQKRVKEMKIKRFAVSRYPEGFIIVRYGDVRWPSYSRWIVPGTIDIEVEEKGVRSI